jgi:branched-chain amino acid transport system substrate-binding protein
MTAEITKAVQQNPDIIFATLYSSVSVLPVVQRLNELNYQGDLAIGWSALDDWHIAEEGGALVDGVMSHVTFFEDPEIPLNMKLVEDYEAYRQATGGTIKHIGDYFMGGYEGLRSLAFAIDKAGSTNGDKITEALWTLDYDSPYGAKFKLLPGGRMYIPYNYIVEAQGGKVVVVDKLPLTELDHLDPYLPPELE